MTRVIAVNCSDMEGNMKKPIILITIILCMGILLFFYMTDDIKAAELPETSEENSVADTRPDYIIYVNRVLNCITIVQKEEDGTETPVRAMVCSCGRSGHGTPAGTFRTSDYYEWREMIDGTYGKYAVRFNGRILFHSVPYMEPSPDTLEWDQYNLLGENASLGCVRLAVEDAKWIYDNCKPGTTVVVYSDSETAGPLGKPDAVSIPEDSPCRGWDPTDTDPGNPWKNGAGLSAENANAAASDTETAVTIETIDTFNYIGYADRYPDLRAAFGYDKTALYQHYITHGIREGRTAF